MTITRPDAEPLVLTRESRVRIDELGLELVAHLATAALSIDETHPFVRQLGAVYPWMSLLSDKDQDECIREITDVAHSAGTDAHLDVLILTLAAWKDSAEAIGSRTGHRRP